MQQVIADIKQDDLAREILNRVDTGPFVSVDAHYSEETADTAFRDLRADFHSQPERRRKTSLRAYSEVTKLLLPVILHVLEGSLGFQEKLCLHPGVSSYGRCLNTVQSEFCRQHTFHCTNVRVAGSPVCSSGERPYRTPQCFSNIQPYRSSSTATASARHTIRQQ